MTTNFSIPRLTPIGHLGKPHGVRGEIVAFLTVDPESLWSALDEQPHYLFVEIDGLVVPFRLSDYRPKGEELYLLTLASVDSRTIAEKLTNHKLFVDTRELRHSDVEFTWQHFVGYEVLDDQDKSVGEVVEVQDDTANILFSVRSSADRTLWLPVHEDLVLYIDTDTQRIGLHIPEGLLDL